MIIKKFSQYIKESNGSDIEDINESAGDKITDIIASNMHNYLVMIINNTNDEDVKEHGSMLGRQMNTAGGSHLMKDEVVSFIYKNRDLIPELLKQLRNVHIDDIIK